jgi:CubicO group peptidase (beta-lactamase class C family)
MMTTVTASASARRFTITAWLTWITVLLIGFASMRVARADDVDDLIAARMRERHLVGVSITVINDGKIVKAQGYGFTDKSGTTPVTPETLFQAGSISKSVAAMGALRLVQDGRLQLHADVNTQLRTWKVPENEFTKDKKVTLRGILSHTAGLTVHGFPGYAVDGAIPSLVQVLDGTGPANTAAIRVDVTPGSKWRYSGGGYTVMQQLILDVTAEPFPQFMSRTVLVPLGMSSSSYEQPLPPAKAAAAATGYKANGDEVHGRWHVYPEMAAAGLWTTPTDLARFAIVIQQSLAGEATPVLSQATTRLMLTEQKEHDALGVFLDGKGDALRFTHGGRDEGFDALMLAYAHVGKGAVVMLNANENKGAMTDVMNAIAKQYGWSEGIRPDGK